MPQAHQDERHCPRLAPAQPTGAWCAGQDRPPPRLDLIDECSDAQEASAANAVGLDTAEPRARQDRLERRGDGDRHHAARTRPQAHRFLWRDRPRPHKLAACPLAEAPRLRRQFLGDRALLGGPSPLLPLFPRALRPEATTSTSCSSCSPRSLPSRRPCSSAVLSRRPPRCSMRGRQQEWASHSAASGSTRCGAGSSRQASLPQSSKTSSSTCSSASGIPALNGRGPG